MVNWLDEKKLWKINSEKKKVIVDFVFIFKTMVETLAKLGEVYVALPRFIQQCNIINYYSLSPV